MGIDIKQGQKGYVVTPSDANELPFKPAILHNRDAVGVLIRVTLSGMDPASEFVDIYFNQGQCQPLQVIKVWATGTTATNIVAITN